MKAVILAGGSGTRAKPFTDYFPKAMIPVEGRPLIDHVINYVSSFDFIDEIVILGDFKGLGYQIKNYYENRTRIGKKRLRFVQDSSSGTGGDLMNLKNVLKRNSDFILWFSDNLSPIDLADMYKFYKEKKSVACIATRKHRKEETGYAIIRDGWISEFKEKPIINLQMSECLGIYMLGAKILKLISSKKKRRRQVNLSFDILQDLSNRKMISAFDIGKTPWIDIDSPTKVERNQELVKKIVKKMRA